MGLLFLVGTVFTAGAVFALATRWRDARQPAVHRVLLSVVAGLLWPLVIAGGLQLGVIALLVKLIRNHDDIQDNGTDTGSAADYALAR